MRISEWSSAVCSSDLAASAQAARYALDPVHTRVMFELSHAGYSQAIGTVSGSTGTLVFDPGDWSVARVEVSVPLLRLDLGDAKWNRAALGRNLLDGDRSEEHTSELQSLMRSSYAVFCLTTKTTTTP